MPPPDVMTPPNLWLCSSETDTITGNLYLAARWDPDYNISEVRAASEASMAWPAFANSPIWSGGNPDSGKGNRNAMPRG